MVCQDNSIIASASSEESNGINPYYGEPYLTKHRPINVTRVIIIFFAVAERLQ